MNRFPRHSASQTPSAEQQPAHAHPEGASASATPAIRAIALTKTYGEGEAQVRPLDQLSVDIEAGRFTAIMGPSGSGKSTLLNMLAGLDTPDSGDVVIGETRLQGLDDKALTTVRRDRIGFIFQAFNLVPAMTAEENILLPSQLAGRTVEREYVARVTGLLGLNDRLRHRPHELSGGQQQRVAVARALVTRPDLIVADEPTGNLDSATGEEVLGLLRASVDEFGQTVVMVTHDAQAASRADRVILLADGRLAGELHRPTPQTVAHALTEVTSRSTEGTTAARAHTAGSHTAGATTAGAHTAGATTAGAHAAADSETMRGDRR